MAEIIFDQSNFSKGQLDKRLSARTDYEGYNQGAKVIRNCFVLPQGGVSKRWGTTYVDTLPLSDFEQSSYKYSKISTLIYDNDIVYLLAWNSNSLRIYLENTLVATVTTPFKPEDINDLRFGQVDNRIIITNENYIPKQLTRSPSAANLISGFNAVNNTLALTTAVTPGQILPVIFSTDTALPTTSPQIYPGRKYFAYTVDANTVRIYGSCADASLNQNQFTISSAGTGANNLIPQNNWAITDITFTYIPSFDFNGGYTNLTFTPSAINGESLTLTASAAIFTANHVGGGFHGNGGIVRINSVSSPTVVTCSSLEDFTDTSAINGSLAFLGEPAWSNLRGWPRLVSFFQNRLVLAGSPNIPNGVWLSVTNEAYNFDDSETLDDNAISWYPAGGSISVINAISSGRSLIFHANTGTFSTPVGSEAPVTPKNFSLIEQNKLGSGKIQPVNIDNQVIYVDQSGNNIRNLVWELSQNSYLVGNISVTASDIINKPFEMAGFADPDFADGSFVLFINQDGNLTIFQTMVEQNVTAWSTADTATLTPNPQSYFQRITTGLTKAWFLVKRQVLNNNNWVYQTFIEQLDFTSLTDCTIKQSLINSNVINNLSPFNGASVQIKGDSYVMSNQTVNNNSLTLINNVNNVEIGHGISSVLTFLPVSNFPQGVYNYYKAKHVRAFYIKYYQTIGAQIQGFDIPSQNLQDVALDSPAQPTDGIYQYTLMEGWDSNSSEISVTQSLPLPMTILGISYTLET